MTTWFPEINTEKFTADAQKAMQAPLGFASPLWLAYAGMASAGVAYWWMTQLSRPQNLEALSGMMEKSSLVPVPEMPSIETPLLAVEPPAAPQIIPPELVVEPVLEAAEVVEEAMEEAIEAALPETVIPEPMLAAAVEPSMETVEAAAEAAPDLLEAAADDLTRLVGIGPSLAVKLADLGVKTYQDIASWTEEDVEKYDKTLKLMGRAMRDNWIGQARQFADQTAH